MTGPSLLQVGRKTREGFKVTYTLCLPWQLKQADYREDLVVVHQGRFFVIKNLLWEGRLCEVACMPYGCMVPRADWPLYAHEGLTTLAHARRYFGHRSKTLAYQDGDPIVLDIACWKEGSFVDSSLDTDLWLPSHFRLSVSFE